MPNKLAVSVALLSALVSPLASAQTRPAVVGSGFTAPTPVTISPGGLTTIFVQGIGSGISAPVIAPSGSLPTTLGGISVVLKQTQAPLGPIAVPILAVFPVAACRTSIFGSCGSLTGINVQIPFELVPNPSTPDAALSAMNYAQLIISEQGGGEATVEATPVTDFIHVVRVGDTLTDPAAASSSGPISSLRPAITHSDGTIVNAANPASPGEQLVLYAVGLGPVSPRVPSGEPSPTSPATASVTMSFEFRPDAAPTNPAVPVSHSIPPTYIVGTPVFSGLSPGFVGLYQINFIVPDLPSGYAVRCNTGPISNLTVSIGRRTSFDGIGICVRIP